MPGSGPVLCRGGRRPRPAGRPGRGPVAPVAQRGRSRRTGRRPAPPLPASPRPSRCRARTGLGPRRLQALLDERWTDGCTNAWKLWEEFVPLGHSGSYQRVRAYLHKKRTSTRPVTARPPSLRTVTRWILSRPKPSPNPNSSSSRPSAPTAPKSTPSPGTSAPSRPCSPSARASTCQPGSTPSARTTCPAFTPSRPASTSMPSPPADPARNSGVVEGPVSRIKMLKRQMFGRAGFALLRKRVLLAP
ncbi:hypothetical protein [Streptomyces tanashiensis]|uniref:hypothetical protein n=1 Tax=Streptomyces tanashiensis TaxID=67367 RepID=UPI003F4E04B1